MGGVRWSKNCHSSHEGPTGSKCQRFNEEQLESLQEDLNQASNVTSYESLVSEEQARAVAEQVETNVKGGASSAENQGSEVNTGQDLILQELKTISQRFGQLENQAAKDREVLASLVTKVNQQGRSALSTQVTTSSITSSLFSPKTSDFESNKTRSRKKSGPMVTLSQEQEQLQFTGSNLSNNMMQTYVQNISGPQIKTIEPINRVTSVISQAQMNKCQSYDVSNSLSSVNTPSQSVMFSDHKAATTPVHVITTQTLKQPQRGSISGLDSQNVHTGLGAVQVPNIIWSEVQPQLIGHNMCTPDNGTSNNLNVFSLTAQQNNTGGAVRMPQVYNRVNNQHSNQESQLGMALTTATAMGRQQGVNEQVIPSLQALRQSSQVNERVQQRYRELEEATGTTNQGNIELLLEVLSKMQKQEKIKVKWPQDLAFIGSMRKRPNYYQLTTCQCAYGRKKVTKTSKKI